MGLVRRYSMFAALLAAVLGGAFVGLFSCGAYALQGPVVLSLIGVLTLTAVVFPNLALVPLSRRAAFAIGVMGLYVVSMAAAAPFYPTAPSSLSEFISLFLGALRAGPC